MQEGLRGPGEGGEGDETEFLLVVFAPHLKTAGLVDPMQHALGIHASGIAAEQNGRLVLTPVIAHPGMADLGDAFSDRAAHFQALAQRTAGEHLDRNPSLGKEFDFVGQCLGADFH